MSSNLSGDLVYELIAGNLDELIDKPAFSPSSKQFNSTGIKKHADRG